MSIHQWARFKFPIGRFDRHAWSNPLSAQRDVGRIIRTAVFAESDACVELWDRFSRFAIDDLAADQAGRFEIQYHGFGTVELELVGIEINVIGRRDVKNGIGGERIEREVTIAVARIIAPAVILPIG